MANNTIAANAFADLLASVVADAKDNGPVADTTAPAPAKKVAKREGKGRTQATPAEVARPRNAQLVADRRAAEGRTQAPVGKVDVGQRTREQVAKVRKAVAEAQASATQDAREGRTQGTQTGTKRTGLNGKVPCACQQARDAETGKPLVEVCGRDTQRTFAPGHDARLKGALIRHGLAGRKVRIGNEPHVYDATTAAGAWGFREQVANGVANPDSKLAKRARRVAKSGAEGGPKTAKPAPKRVVAKVGRWIYEGEVLAAADGQPVFRYTDKKGATKETLKFAKVAK